MESMDDIMEKFFAWLKAELEINESDDAFGQFVGKIRLFRYWLHINGYEIKKRG